MDLYIKITKKFTKKSGSKVINRQYFIERLGFNYIYSHRFEVSIGDKPCGSCLLSKCEVVVDCLRGKVDNDRIRPPNHVYIHCIMDII